MNKFQGFCFRKNRKKEEKEVIKEVRQGAKVRQPLFMDGGCKRWSKCVLLSFSSFLCLSISKCKMARFRQFARALLDS